jgi:hypothetical protein
MSNSTIPAVLDALYEALNGRPALYTVEVNTAYLGPEDIRPEHIVLLGATQTEDQVTSGLANRDEEYTIPGEIWITKPGAGELVIKEARDRAFELRDAVDDCLTDDDISAHCMYAEMVRTELYQGVSPDGRVARIEFDIDIRASLT